MSPSRPRRWLVAAVGIVMAGAPVLATSPAHAGEPLNYASGSAHLECGKEGAQFTGATWVYEFVNLPSSSTSMHFVVELDGVNIYDTILPPGIGNTSLHPVVEDTSTTIVAHADGQLVFSETGTPDCEPPATTPDPGDDTSSQSDGPPAAGPPAADPPPAAPSAQVLSSQAVPAVATLPHTGASTGPLAAAGTGLVLLGLGLVTLGKRRMSLR